MLTGKLAALCLCPALVATPAVIATHPKMRHAVAHMIHRAANRIDSAPVETASAAPSTYCPPTYASVAPGVGGLGGPASGGLAGLLPQDLSALPLPAAAAGDSSYTGAPGAGGFMSSPGAGIGGGYGGGIASSPATGTGAGLGAVSTPTATEGVTEPQNWALLMTGFAATGMLLRSKRLKTT